MNKLWLNTSLLYLFVTALLGTILRLMSFESLGINYTYLLHAHSHTAFLGWLYNILFVILIDTFLSSENKKKESYKKMFWLTQAACIGMLISFPIQGYGLYSISFSAFHTLISFWFTYQFVKDAGSNPDNAGKHHLSFRFIKAALFFMVLSSIGPFSLGPIIAVKGAGSNLYFNAIYFYLHFQYNGWFSFAAIGLFFWILEKNNVAFSAKKGNFFYKIMFISCIPSYLLSVLWTKPEIIIYIIAGASAFLQTAGLVLFLSLAGEIKNRLKEIYGRWAYFFAFSAAICFGLKLVLQLAGAFPYIADLSYHIRNFIIGYLHLIFIGFVAFFIFAFLISQNQLVLNRKTKAGLFLFTSGFILSEIIIFLQGASIWVKYEMVPYYSSLLFFISMVMAAGAALLVINCFKPKQSRSVF